MPRTGDEIRTPLRHVRGHLPRTLHRVHEDERPRVVRYRREFFDRKHRPVCPRQRAETEEFRVRDRVFHGICVESAALAFERVRLDAAPFQPLPREDSRRVFEVGSNDRIPIFPVECGGDAVDTVGRALGERDFVPRRAEVARRPSPASHRERRTPSGTSPPRPTPRTRGVPNRIRLRPRHGSDWGRSRPCSCRSCGSIPECRREVPSASSMG